jgi:regulator of replication initiation timing
LIMAKKKMIFEIPEELEERFRQKIAERKGLHKGVIKQSLEEATRLWIELDDEEIEKLIRKYLPKEGAKKE